ncbi:type II secretion system F family protein [Anaerosoma tenue]|uniref:type II secretion system F family protein n=1 Tax=Anaerosoma tenue TaxID=2933588 RepID=UPI002260D192|nr:type II secretion system F family protein [Anaerosoma tenue]MCK8114417.1 type II secretion system F family protein [Anaerosoma tenue]
MATTTFKYNVRDKTGRVVSGKLEGESREAVATKLRQMGYIILDLDEDRLAQLNKIQFGTSVKIKDVTIFARQFATMINAGLSLTKCLSILADQAENKEMRDIIAQLNRDVEAGQSLSEAMMKHPKIFPPLFYNMVKAGETGGVLDEVLLRVADLFEQDAHLRGRVKSAMMYPMVISILVVVVVIAMMVFVVPTFIEMFSGAGQELPLPTQVLVAMSDYVASIKGVITAIVLVILFFVFKQWTKTDSGKFIWDGIKLRMPVAGNIIRKTSVARFTRTFGTLVAAGVPILSAMDIVADTAGNEVVTRALKSARGAIKEGETIAKPLGESPVFPGMVVQMVAVGEETGALDQMLIKIADFYDEEVGTAIDGLASAMEPIIMVVLAVVVGGIVIALYMPMFQAVTMVA